MLLGLTGRNASGKTTVVNFLVANGFTASSCSDSIRDSLTQQGIEVSRESLIEGGRKLRAQGGGGVLAHMQLAKIEEGADHVIDSIRTPTEVEALRSREGFVLIEVRASIESRWNRLVARGRTGDAENFEQFVEYESAELVAHDESGQALLATAELADIVVHNDGDEAELLAELEQMLAFLRD